MHVYIVQEGLDLSLISIGGASPLLISMYRAPEVEPQHMCQQYYFCMHVEWMCKPNSCSSAGYKARAEQRLLAGSS